MADLPRETIRLDKWLWQARFFKTRGLATKLVQSGKVRVDGTPVSKPSRAVGAGDTLTFPQSRQIRVVTILALGTRRGPATEAQQLYHDLTEVKETGPASPRYEGKGRPSKKDRRSLDLNRRAPLE